MQKVEANPDSSSFWRMLQRPFVGWVQPWAASCRVHRPGTPWQAFCTSGEFLSAMDCYNRLVWQHFPSTTAPEHHAAASLQRYSAKAVGQVGLASCAAHLDVLAIRVPLEDVAHANLLQLRSGRI